MSMVFTFKKGRSKTDQYATTIVAALNFVLKQIKTKMEVIHLPRISDEVATWADHLSRFDWKGELQEYKSIEHKCSTTWLPPLLDWLSNPKLDQSLGQKLWSYLESHM